MSRECEGCKHRRWLGRTEQTDSILMIFSCIFEQTHPKTSFGLYRCKTAKSLCLSNAQINKLKSISRKRHAHTQLTSHYQCTKSHKSVSIPHRVTNTISLWPAAIDFQALSISDNQPINELCSISQATPPVLQDLCVHRCLSVCIWQSDGMCVFVSMCHLIGALMLVPYLM